MAILCRIGSGLKRVSLLGWLIFRAYSGTMQVIRLGT